MLEEIKNGNALIDEFMDTAEECRKYMRGYHYSFDWLMPVIERMKFIEDHQEDFFEEYHLINFKMEFFYSVELWIDKERLFLQTAFGENTLIDAIYKAVIEFIKWYNINKRKQILK